MRRMCVGATVARRKGVPADRRVRDALIVDAERLQQRMSAVGAGDYVRLADLLAGGAVVVGWWELPDPVKDSLRRPHDVNELWELGTDDELRQVE